MKHAGVWVALMAALAIAGCGKAAGDKDVLATVGSQKITVAQLDSELKVGGVADAANPKVRQAALDQIVARKLLALAAREGKLDSSPEARVLKAATVETFEAALQRRMVLETVARPTPAQAAAFIQAHPEMFAQRTGYLIDQLHVATPSDTTLMDALRPAMTLEAVESVLQARSIPFRRSVEQLDTLRADPRLTAAVRKLRPGEPFVLLEPGGFTVSRVRGSQVQPVAGAQATTIATELLLAQNRAQALQAWLDAQKAAKVRYPDAPKPAKAGK